MTPLLQQFLSEGREFLQAIGQKLMQLENAPNDVPMMSDLFRSVHTLKGNSGLFEFPEMSRVLHAAEDLLAVVRDGDLPYSQPLADRLLDSMDFVGMLLDETEAGATSAVKHSGTSVKLAESLRRLIPSSSIAPQHSPKAGDPTVAQQTVQPPVQSIPWEEIPQSLRAAWQRRPTTEPPLHLITYIPETDCFFKGEDPFHQARQIPQVEWQRVTPLRAWPPLADFDPYQCVLKFQLISGASRTAIDEQFRYVPEQVVITTIPMDGEVPSSRAIDLTASAEIDGAAAATPTAFDGIARSVVDAQLTILRLSGSDPWVPGRVKAAASALASCYRSTGRIAQIPGLESACAASLSQSNVAPLLGWWTDQTPATADANVPSLTEKAPPFIATEPPRGRRAEDHAAAPKILKVDQAKIDRLMGLIGEMVVAKNGLPFLAGRAESVYGSRDLSREIKNQHAVINRVAGEMQDVIMQVRMTPVSTVFQRFPRLVRDISRKLGKQAVLVLEGEETEADKNIIESLADPLLHIIRNSLDHGIELPTVRIAVGKPPEGTVVIRASQQADRVVIDISDDGKGIDPTVIKRKAFEKGIIDQLTLERISDLDAVNLVFAAGFSTADQVSDLSGRGVGMDVVRTAVEHVNGTVTLDSIAGHGTHIRLSLPLSMAVTNVMIVESNRQVFGVPMDMVLETVRVPRAAVRCIKNRQTTVLRNRVMPLRSLNELLAAGEPQIANEADEIAALVVEIQGEHLGLVVDNFREVVDIILKPMTGILGGLPGYAGSALLGDGSVLIVLNPRELVSWA